MLKLAQGNEVLLGAASGQGNQWPYVQVCCRVMVVEARGVGGLLCKMCYLARSVTYHISRGHNVDMNDLISLYKLIYLLYGRHMKKVLSGSEDDKAVSQQGFTAAY